MPFCLGRSGRLEEQGLGPRNGTAWGHGNPSKGCRQPLTGGLPRKVRRLGSGIRRLLLAGKSAPMGGILHQGSCATTEQNTHEGIVPTRAPQEPNKKNKKNKNPAKPRKEHERENRKHRREHWRGNGRHRRVSLRGVFRPAKLVDTCLSHAAARRRFGILFRRLRKKINARRDERVVLKRRRSKFVKHHSIGACAHRCARLGEPW